jgi:hypothetical protein
MKGEGSMSKFEGRFSSIRPVPKISPADMRRNGVFKIAEYDSGSGRVAGYYYDLEEFYNEKFTGTITPTGSTYHFSLEHPDPKIHVTRKYEGDFIAEEHDIIIVAGRWHNEYPEDFKRDKQDLKVARQDEGVWVATKP